LLAANIPFAACVRGCLPRYFIDYGNKNVFDPLQQMAMLTRNKSTDSDFIFFYISADRVSPLQMQQSDIATDFKLLRSVLGHQHDQCAQYCI